MKIFVDIDNTICKTEGSDYINSTPIENAIHKINRLFENGHTITYWTARGGNSGIDWLELTVKQLAEWGCLYHTLSFDKPSYDCVLDDKALRINDVRLGAVGGVSGIYKIESIEYPDRFYIGSAKDITKRWNGHIYHLERNKHHSSILQNHYNEYGKIDLKFSIVEECSVEYLIDREREYLKNLNPYFNIYKEPGSPKNHKFSDEARKNMGKSNLGKKQSEETKRKRSLSMMGHSVSEETKEKLREKRKNYRHSKETLLKLSISHIGSTTGFKPGHEVSAEMRKKFSDFGKKNSVNLKRNDKGQFIKRKNIEEI